MNLQNIKLIMLKSLLLFSFTFSCLVGTAYAESSKQDKMKYFLMIGKPSSSAWSGIVKNEADMSIEGRKGIEAMGGKMLGFYIGVGEAKNYAIVAFPDSAEVARIVFTREMQGVMDELEFIEIMTTEQAAQIFKKVNSKKIGGNT